MVLFAGKRSRICSQQKMRSQRLPCLESRSSFEGQLKRQWREGTCKAGLAGLDSGAGPCGFEGQLFSARLGDTVTSLPFPMPPASTKT